MASGSNRSQQQTDSMRIDHLALSRAKHFQTRDERIKSISDDDIGPGSDWSDSDRECCPLSDSDCASTFDQSMDELRTTTTTTKNPFLQQILHFNPPSTSTDVGESAASTRISFNHEQEKPIRHQYVKKGQTNGGQQQQQQRSGQAPLLAARRMQTRADMARRASIRSTTTTSQSSFSSHVSKPTRTSQMRIHNRRETQSKESRSSPNSSIYSHEKSLLDDHQIHHRRNLSPNFSQSSMPRVYEMKKCYTDDNDYGRLTDVNQRKSSPARERQKWGTIVHPPFPLGYQQINSEQLNQVVERLASPVRCRDRHINVQSPSKRYLTIEETTALINRLSKVKTVRTPDQVWPAQRPSRSVKTLHNTNATNWKTVSAPA